MKGNHYQNFIVTLVIGIIFLADGVVIAIVNYRNNTVTALLTKNQVFYIKTHLQTVEQWLWLMCMAFTES